MALTTSALSCGALRSCGALGGEVHRLFCKPPQAAPQAAPRPHAAQRPPDTAQAILVTRWNAAMAAGGIIGGLILNTVNATAIPRAAAVLGVVRLLVMSAARHSAFPETRTEA